MYQKHQICGNGNKTNSINQSSSNLHGTYRLGKTGKKIPTENIRESEKTESVKTNQRIYMSELFVTFTSHINIE